MLNQLLFIQGGDADGYTADQAMVTALKQHLGGRYEMHYPPLESDESAPDFGWVSQIANKISGFNDGVIVVAHSLGASMLLKCLSEQAVSTQISGLFLLATPYWSGDEDWKAGLKLDADFASKLRREVPIYLYHCKDDDTVPYSQFQEYQASLPQAIFREFKTGGHQFDGCLNAVAEDIISLMQF